MAALATDGLALGNISKPIQGSNIFFLTGVSGSGKNLLLDRLRKRLGRDCEFIISYTTRNPREGEIDGIHYYFVSEEVFKEKVKGDDFAEWAEVHSNYYGTPKKPIDVALKEQKIVLIDLDIQGAINLKETYPRARGIFIYCSPNEQERRILDREPSIEDSDLQERLRNASREISGAQDSGVFQEIIESITTPEDIRIGKEKMHDIIWSHLLRTL